MMNNKILEKSLSYIWWHSSRFWEWFHFLHCKTCHLHKRSVRIIIKVLGSLFFYCTFLIFVCGLWISSLGLVSQYDVCATLWLWWEFFNRMSGFLHVILHIGLGKSAWESEQGSLDSGADFSLDHRKHLKLRTLQKILLKSSPC